MSTSTSVVDDPIGRYATQHRSYINSQLEEKLRQAGYRPSDGPNMYTPESWLARFGVDRFELERIWDVHRM